MEQNIGEILYKDEPYEWRLYSDHTENMTEKMELRIKKEQAANPDKGWDDYIEEFKQSIGDTF